MYHGANLHIDTIDPFTILEPQDQEIGEVVGSSKSRATDFEAPKLGNGWSGYSTTFSAILLLSVISGFL